MLQKQKAIPLTTINPLKNIASIQFPFIQHWKLSPIDLMNQKRNCITLVPIRKHLIALLQHRSHKSAFHSLFFPPCLVCLTKYVHCTVSQTIYWQLVCCFLFENHITEQVNGLWFFFVSKSSFFLLLSVYLVFIYTFTSIYFWFTFICATEDDALAWRTKQNNKQLYNNKISERTTTLTVMCWKKREWKKNEMM